jgi:hypothetical protein
LAFRTTFAQSTAQVLICACLSVCGRFNSDDERWLLASNQITYVEWRLAEIKFVFRFAFFVNIAWLTMMTMAQRGPGIGTTPFNDLTDVQHFELKARQFVRHYFFIFFFLVSHLCSRATTP